jgi:hypothetical protein
MADDLVTQALHAFVNGRILRYVEEKGLYEIAHDSLARQVHTKRSDDEIALLEVQRLVQSQITLKPEVREYFTEKQLALIEPYLGRYQPSAEALRWITESKEVHEASKKAAEEHQRKELAESKRRVRILGGLLVIAVLAVFAAGYFAWQASKNAVAAYQAQEAAQKNLKSAYQADLNRINTEIAASERNLAAYKRFNAGNDVKDLEQKKIDSLEKRVIDLERQIKILSP